MNKAFVDPGGYRFNMQTDKGDWVWCVRMDNGSISVFQHVIRGPDDLRSGLEVAVLNNWDEAVAMVHALAEALDAQ